MYSNNLGALIEHFWDKDAKTFRLDLHRRNPETLCPELDEGKIVNEAIDKLYLA